MSIFAARRRPAQGGMIASPETPDIAPGAQSRLDNAAWAATETIKLLVANLLAGIAINKTVY